MAEARASVRQQLQLDVVVSDSQMYWFWPRLDGAQSDLVVRIGSLLDSDA
jgi:hypothetical protein